ncbi:[NiFe]-hydrogenase assembly chaperone HybE [Sinimarinibacterium sp. CAU 1509]|uniref:[NiFe]-hydrogenase assembly chaperone HybE n=1 Tax=Sinimarinibacterium sp. CAU 1509 TaxID=2562283 RepID=UPI00146EE56D|nr:[NiFe]-hydrogenase assembly chaperone HybE [Sinimarinibacterium sp. CAU 1509]
MASTTLAQVRERVESAFVRIAQTRMRDFPLSNAALSVQLVGLRDWGSVRIGVLITPWSINLLLLPGADTVGADAVQSDDGFRRLGSDEQQHWTLPSASYAFYGLEDDAIGPYQTCSLFSPALEFPTQDAAVETAQAVMLALFQPPDLESDVATGPVSRRELLHGRLSAASTADP